MVDIDGDGADHLAKEIAADGGRAVGCRTDVGIRLWDGSTRWLVTRYADQKALLADERVCADITRPGFPHVNLAFREVAVQRPSFLFMDDPQHARIRRMITAPFTLKRIEALRPAVQRNGEAQLRRDATAEQSHGYFQHCSHVQVHAPQPSATGPVTPGQLTHATGSGSVLGVGKTTARSDESSKILFPNGP